MNPGIQMKLFVTLVVVTALMALVAATEPVVNMDKGHKDDHLLSELLEVDGLLIFGNQQKDRKSFNRSSAVDYKGAMLDRGRYAVTEAPPIVLTTHASAEKELAILEADDFLITADDTPLSRHKRGGADLPEEGSGFPDTTVEGSVTTEEVFDASSQSQSIIDLIQEALVGLFTDGGISFDSVTVIVVVDNGGFAQYRFQVSFTVTTQSRLMAWTLMRLFRQGRLGRFGLRGIPTLTNAAAVEREAICFLCPPDSPCTPGSDVCGTVPEIPSSDLFPFGFSQLDNRLPPFLDSISDPIIVPDGLPFFSNLQNILYIGDNGGISLRTPYNPWDLDDLANAAEFFIAPFNADFDLRYGGDVFFQAYFAGDVWGDSILRRATAEVRNYQPYPDFVASWVLVVTWYDVQEFTRINGAPIPQRNTFQVVLISDGIMSFKMTFYKLFEASPLFRGSANLGYTDTETTRKLEYSRIDDIFATIDPLDIIVGNTGLVGIWMTKIGDTTVRNENAFLCEQWYLRNIQNGGRQIYKARARAIGSNTCPCRRGLVRFDPNLLGPRDRGQNPYCVESFWGPNVDSYECCYDGAGRFLTNQPQAGSYNAYHSLFFPGLHLREDVLPKQWCCELSNNCDLYEDIRPTTSCQRIVIVVVVWILGDPHFSTLDRKPFTFNALGEFTLTRLSVTTPEPFTFDLQCRTEQAVDTSGNKQRASVFTAFAGKLQSTSATISSGSFHVGLNPAKTKFVLYVNEVDETNQFYNDENYLKPSLAVTVSRTSETQMEINMRSIGITMSVRLNQNSLNFAITVDPKYKTLTTGLLGNYNDNDEDDFKSPDGTAYAASSTDRQLLPFGKSWAVDANSSVMHYDPGQSFSNFVDDSFVPLFYDEISDTQKNEAITANACTDLTQVQCIYDYVVTKNAALAQGTEDGIDQANTETNEIANESPVLTGTTEIRIEIGQTANLTYQATDANAGDTVSYVAVESPSSGFALDSTSGQATWTPADTTPVSISITAQDSNSAQSPAISVRVLLCEGCGANGACDYDNPKTTPASANEQNFLLASCKCSVGWEGTNCTDDVNGCLNNPCGSGRSCTDVAAAVQAANSGNPGFTCTDCASGYTTSPDGTKCEDINECSIGTPCNGNARCENTLGSFICVCNEGYRKNSADVCIDINECEEHLHGCQQVCTNSVGSYTCSCNVGTLAGDGKACTPPVAAPDCTTLGCTGPGSYCNSDASACLCETGYELGQDAKTCTDINECDRKLCAQECTNTVGSFTCSCLPGFQLAQDGLDCTACTFPNYGLNCGQKCDCKGRSDTCDTVQGCQCHTGWSGVDCSINVNECEVDPNICGEVQNCTDTEGSYKCTCPAGYAANGTDCVDINECEDQSVTPCPMNSDCQNLIGSYVCNCRAGYNKVGGVCQDINECENGQSTCQHTCINQEGSYNCFCKPGFLINDDRKTCSNDPTFDPCTGLTNVQCDHICAVVDAQPVCQCNQGYYLAADGQTCLDFNECDNTTTNGCGQTDTCTNTAGSYTCSCPDGQKLQNDGRTCLACDDNHWGPDCANSCECVPQGTNTCDKIQGCSCKTGWTGEKCQIDIDECGSSNCTANSDCNNTPGSFTCTCRTGYRMNAAGTVCDEINECANDADNVCDHICTDTIGSYTCSCRTGFLLEGKGKCNDIDECLKGSHDCQQKCRNTQGGYTCECFDGFLLDPVTRTTCSPDPTATQCGPTHGCDNCRVESGTEICYCNTGYRLNADGKTCDDINECTDADTTLNQCSGTCSNGLAPAGGYTCTCPLGQKLQADGRTCAVCVDGTWGPNCANNCTCVSANTMSCNPATGVCNCNSGWTGGTCADDILECADTNICGANGVCNELDGSYACTCVAGFSRGNNMCNPCTGSTYGIGCASACQCNFTNTATCSATDGACLCKTGWTGSTCNNNINECTATPSTVCQGNHEVCADTMGSYECNCEAGYEKAPNNTCVDVNECLSATLNTCTFVCNNVDGTFSCSCPRGYLGTGNACTQNYFRAIAMVTLDTNRAAIIANTLSAAYIKLQQDIGLGMDAVIRPVVGVAYLNTIIVALTAGSVVAEAELRMDLSQTTDPTALMAIALERLAEVGQIDIAGSPTNLTALRYNNTHDIVKDHSVCDVYKLIRTFSDNEYCELVDGIPTAKKVPSTDVNLPLAIGLPIAVFVVLFIIAVIIIYVCCRRRSKKAHSDRTPSEDREVAFRSAFAGSVPTKANFAAPNYMLYHQHAFSDSGSEASGDSTRRFVKLPKRNGRHDFGDMPHWIDERSNGYSGLGNRQPQVSSREEPASNFSWENMFSMLEPLRNGPFEIQRPAVNSAANRAYRDSLA